jgi:tetratricopeptide (TPR) repeat protein
MRFSQFSKPILLPLFALAAFFPVLSAGFIYWDDHELLTAYAPVLNFDLENIFFNLKVGGLFPLSLFSLALQNRIHGLDPFYFHAANMILHIANGYLVYLCAKKIFELDEKLSSIAAVLFLVHPLRVEPVAWVSGGRKDLLCALFFLSALLTYRKSYLGSLALAVAALLSKAMAVTLPAAILLTYPMRKERVTRKDLFRLVPFAVLSIAAILLEMKGQRTNEVLSESGSFAGGLVSGFTALAFSAARTLTPNALAIFYEPGAFHFTPADYAGMGLAALSCAWLFNSGFKNWWPLAMFLVSALPVLKFIPFGQASVFNDRYLYLPGFCLSIFIATGTYHLSGKRNPYLALVLVPGFIAISYIQSKTWRNQETVWLNVLEHYPGTKKAYQNLSLYYIENRLNDKALETTLKSQELSPNDMSTKVNLGVLYSRLERYAEAEKTFLEVLKVEPGNVIVHHNLAFAYAKAGYKAEAIAHYKEALRLDPNFAPSANALRELDQGFDAGSPGGMKAGSPTKK